MLHSSEGIVTYFSYSWTLSKLACWANDLNAGTTHISLLGVNFQRLIGKLPEDWQKLSQSFQSSMRTLSTKENALCLQHIPTCGCLVWSCTQIQHSILVKNLRSAGNRFLNRDLVRRLRLPHDGTPASSDGAFVRLVIVSSTSAPLSQSTGHWSVEPLVCNYQARWWPPVALIATDGGLKSSICVCSVHIVAVQREPKSRQIAKEISNDLPNLLNLL